MLSAAGRRANQWQRKMDTGEGQLALYDCVRGMDWVVTIFGIYVFMGENIMPAGVLA